jgi:hypothetical protein
MQPTTRVVYLLAASHSGSTLLALLLNGHAELCSVGELKVNSLGDVSRYRCSCGRLILTCPFWDGVTGDLNGAGVGFSIERPGTDFSAFSSPTARRLLRPLHRGRAFETLRDVALSLSPAWRRHLGRTQENNVALMRAVLARSGKRAIVDSSKIGLRLKYLLRNASLDVRVVRLVRDGRAVALTYMDPAVFADSTRPELRGGGAGGTRESERLDMAAAAREWRRSQEEADAVLRGVDRSRWVQLRYEDLCRDPESELRRVFSFLDVASEVKIVLRGSEHHVIGNGMRLDDSREVRLDERWREALSPADLSIFEHVAGETNRRLGYR